MSRRSDGSPGKDRGDRQDVMDRGGKEHSRPGSATTKATAIPGKKGKYRTFVISAFLKANYSEFALGTRC